MKMTLDERKAKYEAEHPAKAPTKRKVVLSLDPLQFSELQSLMLEDVQTNFTTFGVYLIMQERKRRIEEKRKKGVGRPRNDGEEEEEEEKAIYPHPDNFGPNKGRLLTRTELDWYNANHGTGNSIT
jgi:hypothetical protein